MTATLLLLMVLLQTGALAQSFEEVFALGLRLSNERRWQEAEQAFRRAAELEPRAPAPHVELGRIHLRRDEPVRAIAALDEALRRSPWAAGGERQAHRGLRASVAIGLTPRRSDRYAISWMGIVAASVGREEGKHESGASMRPRAPTGIQVHPIT